MRMPDNEGRPAPGIDNVTSELNAFKVRLREQIAQEKTHWARVSAITPIQDAIAAQYKEAVLDPRKKIWDKTIGILQHRTPESVTIEGSGEEDPTVNLTWKIKGVTSHTEEPLGIEATITAGIDLERTEEASEVNDLIDAIEFASGENPYDNKFFRWNPFIPPAVLGVARIGKGKNQTIPQDLLLQRIAEKASPLADELEISIQPTTDSVVLFDFYVSRTDATQGDNTLLMHDRTYDLEEQVKEARGDKEYPTIDDIRLHLEEYYAEKAQEGVGSEFQILEGINTLLVDLKPAKKPQDAR